MKKWVEKLIEQFDFEWTEHSEGGETVPAGGLSEERATILYLIDTFNKHLIEVDGHPVRKVREMLDEFAKEILDLRAAQLDQSSCFAFASFFGSYRIDETAYLQKTFEEFRTIIWDFVDQLSEDMTAEQHEDFEIQQHLNENSKRRSSPIPSTNANPNRANLSTVTWKNSLKRKEKRNSSRIKSIRNNLNHGQKTAQMRPPAAWRIDHMTQALNRKSFGRISAQQYPQALSRAGISRCSLILGRHLSISSGSTTPTAIRSAILSLKNW